MDDFENLFEKVKNEMGLLKKKTEIGVYQSDTPQTFWLYRINEIMCIYVCQKSYCTRFVKCKSMSSIVPSIIASM